LDDTYQVYVNRVARMTLPETYQSQVQYIQPSPKFEQDSNGEIQPAPFPGYTVITPPFEEDSKNTPFFEHLQTYQQQVVQQLEPGLVIPVPPSSFHFTLGDLIWASAYQHAIENPTFEKELHECVAQSFQKSQELVQSEKPIYWEVIGLFLRTRAIGVCLAPKEEDSYERVVRLRRTIYQNPDLIGLGIEQQYNFTAHITLGYFGEVAATVDRDRLSENLIALSQQWLEEHAPQEIWLHRAELRKFDDMTRYYREPDWTVLEF
jgi:2'-5' RNA ligase